MTIAYWCVLIAALLPYLWTGLAKISKPHFNNNEPRIFLDKLEGWGQRANWAQQNSFEAFPVFAVAVIIANQIGSINPNTLDNLAITFIIARIFYGIFYLTNQATLRSIVWSIGAASWLSMFVLSA